MVDLRLPAKGSGLAPHTLRFTAKKIVAAYAGDLAAVAFLLVITFLFYWRILTPDSVNRASFPQGDFTEQFYAFAFFRAQELLSGRLPLWNPFTYAGHPFIADIQSAVFYPIGWITTVIAGKDYPVIALECEAVGHVFLAGVFTYAFGRLRFRGRLPAIVSALVFAFGGYLTSYPSQQLSILEVQIWLPLVLFFAHLATSPKILLRARVVYTVLGGAVVGISALAGHPQAYMYVLYGTMLYLAFRLFEIRADYGGRTFLSALWIPVAFLAVGLGVAAVQLVPTYELMLLSSRAKLSYDFTSWGFPIEDVLQIVLPGSASAISPMYVGIFPLILAVVAVIHHRSRQVVFWALLAGGALLLSFGGHTFLYSVFYLAVPGFSTFRDQERAVYLASFATAQLAGYGAVALADADFAREWIAKLAKVLLVASLGAFALLVGTYLVKTASGRLGDQMSAAAFLFAVLLLSLVLVQAQRQGIANPIFAVAAVGLIFFDLFSVNWKNNLEEKKPEDFYQVTPLVRYLQENSVQGRVVNEHQLPGNYGCVYGVEDVGGASPLEVERFRLLSQLPQERLWEILNVRYLLTWQGGFEGGRKISVENQMNLYELPTPMPRASLLHDVVVKPKDEDALALLASPTFDPRRTVILAEQPGMSVPQAGTSPSQATFSMLDPDRLLIQTNDNEPGILLVSELFYPGWKAWVDGKPAEILRADVALRAVPLDGGKHTVEMVFEPNSVKLGMALSGITLGGSLLLLLGVALWPTRRPS